MLTVPSGTIVKPHLFHVATHTDSRGSFTEGFRASSLTVNGLQTLPTAQVNVSTNLRAGITRGIHVQPWSKYVFVGHGRAFVAIVDVRRGTEFGRVHTFDLTPGVALLIPPGFGNAYQSLAPNTVYIYIVDKEWDGGTYTGIRWNDPDLAIPWLWEPREGDVSDNDKGLPLLKDFVE